MKRTAGFILPCSLLSRAGLFCIFLIKIDGSGVFAQMAGVAIVLANLAPGKHMLMLKGAGYSE